MVETVKQVYWLIVIAVTVIIGLGGGIFSVYNFWDSATNDRPEEKKKGITSLIVTVVALVVVIAIATIMWNSLSGYLSQFPSSVPTT